MEVEGVAAGFGIGPRAARDSGSTAGWAAVGLPARIGQRKQLAIFLA